MEMDFGDSMGNENIDLSINTFALQMPSYRCLLFTKCGRNKNNPDENMMMIRSNVCVHVHERKGEKKEKEKRKEKKREERKEEGREGRRKKEGREGGRKGERKREKKLKTEYSALKL